MSIVKKYLKPTKHYNLLDAIKLHLCSCSRRLNYHVSIGASCVLKLEYCSLISIVSMLIAYHVELELLETSWHLLMPCRPMLSRPSSILILSAPITQSRQRCHIYGNRQRNIGQMARSVSNKMTKKIDIMLISIKLIRLEPVEDSFSFQRPYTMRELHCSFMLALQKQVLTLCLLQYR